jgi:hypothetical protein
LIQILGQPCDFQVEDEEIVVTTLKQEEWAVSPSDADYADLAHANRAGSMAL